MRFWLGAGAVNGFVAVAMGAFAAHGLEGRVAAQALGWVETAARYQLAHAPALIAVAWLVARADGEGVRAPRSLRAAGWGFVAGTLLFSGLLYLMALTGARWLGALVPLGGLAFLLGWAALLVYAVRPRPGRPAGS